MGWTVWVLNPHRGKSYFSIFPLQNVYTGSGDQPASYSVDGHRASFSWVRLPGSDFVYLPPSRAEVKNEWSCTSIVTTLPLSESS